MPLTRVLFRVLKALVLTVTALALAGHFLLWHDDFLLSGNSGVAVIVRTSQASLYLAGTLSLLLLAWATFATRRFGVYVALVVIAVALYLSATTVVVTLLGGGAYNVIGLVYRSERIQLIDPTAGVNFTSCHSFGPVTTFLIDGKHRILWTGYWPFALDLGEYDEALRQCQVGRHAR